MTKDELYAQIRENYNELKTVLQAEDANHFLFLAQYRKNHEWVTRLTRSGCFLEKASGIIDLGKFICHALADQAGKASGITDLVKYICHSLALIRQEKHRELLIQVNISAITSSDQAGKASGITDLVKYICHSLVDQTENAS